jgi:acetylglutamate kinase
MGLEKADKGEFEVGEKIISSAVIKYSKRFPEASVEVKMPEEFLMVAMDGVLIEQARQALGDSRIQLVVTDEETMRVVQRVLAGETNKDLVKLLCAEGSKAVGLCGLDAGLITARPEAEDLGLVGHITGVDVSIVETLLEKGCIPVIASVAGDGEGRSYNVNADTAAAAIAGALGARRLVLMTDINGLMRDVKDPDSLISVLTTEDIGPLKEQGVISGGMIPKIDCALHAIESGVERVAMINGTLPHSILVEMLTKGGITRLLRG